jgi:hypothetical protein
VPHWGTLDEGGVGPTITKSCHLPGVVGARRSGPAKDQHREMSKLGMASHRIEFVVTTKEKAEFPTHGLSKGSY